MILTIYLNFLHVYEKKISVFYNVELFEVPLPCFGLKIFLPAS